MTKRTLLVAFMLLLAVGAIAHSQEVAVDPSGVLTLIDDQGRAYIEVVARGYNADYRGATQKGGNFTFDEGLGAYTGYLQWEDDDAKVHVAQQIVELQNAVELIYTFTAEERMSVTGLVISLHLMDDFFAGKRIHILGADLIDLRAAGDESGARLYNGAGYGAALDTAGVPLRRVSASGDVGYSQSVWVNVYAPTSWAPDFHELRFYAPQTNMTLQPGDTRTIRVKLQF